MNQEMVIKRTKVGGDDSIIIKKCIKTLEGGRMVIAGTDSNSAQLKVLRAGTPVYRHTVSGKTVYTGASIKARVDSGAPEGSLEFYIPNSISGAVVVGVIKSTVECNDVPNGSNSTTKAAPCSIMTEGVVNPKVADIAYFKAGTAPSWGESVIKFEVDEPSDGTPVYIPGQEA